MNGVIRIVLDNRLALVPFSTSRKDKSVVVEELRKEIRMLIVAKKELKVKK